MVNFSKKTVPEEKGRRPAIPEAIALQYMEPQLRTQVETWLHALDSRSPEERSLQDYVNGKERIALN